MIKIVFALVLSALANSEGYIYTGYASRWPSGQYCLPMPHSKHCPLGWAKGYRYHDTEDSRNANRKGGYVPYISFGGNGIEWGFCCKRKDHSWQSYVPWPKGQYCIFRKGGSCPGGFNEGRMRWDDENRGNNNRASGTLPDGIYNRNTDIYFCCRNDGSRGLIKAKRLPRCKCLILMRYNNACPAVSGYRGPYTGYLEWDNEDKNNKDEKHGVYPDGVSSLAIGIKIEFCTYKS